MNADASDTDGSSLALGAQDNGGVIILDNVTVNSQVVLGQQQQAQQTQQHYMINGQPYVIVGSGQPQRNITIQLNTSQLVPAQHNNPSPASTQVQQVQQPQQQHAGDTPHAQQLQQYIYQQQQSQQPGAVSLPKQKVFRKTKQTPIAGGDTNYSGLFSSHQAQQHLQRQQQQQVLNQSQQQYHPNTVRRVSQEAAAPSTFACSHQHQQGDLVASQQMQIASQPQGTSQQQVTPQRLGGTSHVPAQHVPVSNMGARQPHAPQPPANPVTQGGATNAVSTPPAEGPASNLKTFMISNKLKANLIANRRYCVHDQDCVWNGSQFISTALLPASYLTLDPIYIDHREVRGIELPAPAQPAQARAPGPRGARGRGRARVAVTGSPAQLRPTAPNSTVSSPAGEVPVVRGSLLQHNSTGMAVPRARLQHVMGGVPPAASNSQPPRLPPPRCVLEGPVDLDDDQGQLPEVRSLDGEDSRGSSSGGANTPAPPPVVEALPPPPPPEPDRLLEGPDSEYKFVLCSKCGNSGKNLSVCEGCKRRLPPDAKVYSRAALPAPQRQATVATSSSISSNVPAKASPGVVTVVGRSSSSIVHFPTTKPKSRPALGGRARMIRTVEEPVTVTILDSSDEEEAAPKKNGGEGSSPSKRTSTTSPVAPTPDAKKQKLSRRAAMLGPDGKPIPGGRLITVPKKRGTESKAADTEPKIPNTQLDLTCVYVGNLKLWPQRRAELSLRGLKLELRDKSDCNIMVNLCAREVEDVFLSEELPTIFLYVTPECAARVRGACDMSRDSGPYFDPTSFDEPERRLVLLLKKLEGDAFEHTKLHMERTVCRPRSDKSAAVYAVDKGIASAMLAVSAPKEADQVCPDVDKEEAAKQIRQLEETLNVGVREESTCQEPVRNLFIYPFPPATGGVTVTNHDMWCLREAEFLNDVIIDFYLKYLVQELPSEMRERTYLFNSFFYKRMTHRPSRKAPISLEEATMPPAQRRHSRVKKWTRNVDLFDKDFVVVPINESSHWYLAIICYPGLMYPVIDVVQTPAKSKVKKTSAEKKSEGRKTPDEGKEKTEEKADDTEASKMDVDDEEPPVALASSQPSSEPEGPSAEPQEGDKTPSDVLEAEKDGAEGETGETVKTDDKEESTQPADDDNDDTQEGKKAEKGEKPEEDGDEKRMEDDQEEEEDEEEDKGIPDKISEKCVIKKQPCILVFDSLSAPQSHVGVIRTLREYLELEWASKGKEPAERVFNKDTFKGCAPKVPQQNNYSDCGLYLLQYVESFFQDPPQEYRIPLRGLEKWFPHEAVSCKRSEIRELLCDFERKYEATVPRYLKPPKR